MFVPTGYCGIASAWRMTHVPSARSGPLASPHARSSALIAEPPRESASLRVEENRALGAADHQREIRNAAILGRTAGPENREIALGRERPRISKRTRGRDQGNPYALSGRGEKRLRTKSHRHHGEARGMDRDRCEARVRWSRFERAGGKCGPCAWAHPPRSPRSASNRLAIREPARSMWARVPSPVRCEREHGGAQAQPGPRSNSARGPHELAPARGGSVRVFVLGGGAALPRRHREHEGPVLALLHPRASRETARSRRASAAVPRRR
jgi:hypothetical protein